jgi:hypothetical protein
MPRVRFLVPLLAAAISAGPAPAQTYLDQIGYTALQGRLGAATPNGAGVWVAQVEAIDQGNYAPDPAVAAGRPGFTLTLRSGASGISGHATGVAGIFYGNGGMATGVTQVDAYSADHWIGNGFLGSGTVNLPPITNIPKVSNHSYVSDGDSAATADGSNDALLRADYLVDRGDHVMVVGVGKNNATPASPPAYVFGSGFNSIAVGRTDGGDFAGLTAADVGGGRVKPDLVAPDSSVSGATPMVAAAAVLLVQTAGSTPFAAKPQTIKAVLLAGATKGQFATAAGGPWTHTQTVPLDVRFGAGQVNIDNSYKILSAGRQVANDSATVAPTGWDFNTVGTPGPTARTYFFDLPAEAAGHTLSAALTWHRVVSDALVAAPLANLDLKLFNVTTGFTTGAMIDQSVSVLDNVEHVWVPNGLPAGRYAWRVELAAGATTDYAVAWQANFVPVPEPGAVILAAAAVLAVGRRVRNR